MSNGGQKRPGQYNPICSTLKAALDTGVMSNGGGTRREPGAGSTGKAWIYYPDLPAKPADTTSQLGQCRYVGAPRWKSAETSLIGALMRREVKVSERSRYQATQLTKATARQ